MISGAYANVLDYGADATGGATSTLAFQKAVDSLPLGGVVYVPPGTYLLFSAVVLNSKITIKGAGASSILKGAFAGPDYLISANGKTNLILEDLHFNPNGVSLIFVSCSYVQIINCSGDGVRVEDNNLTAQGFSFNGCDQVDITNCFFSNYRDCIYLDKAGATPCVTVRVTGGRISQTVHGSLVQYPTGVYAYECVNCTVTNVEFSNIKPSSNSTDPAPYGYGFYEGDGVPGTINAMKVINCRFLDDDVSTAFPMIGAFMSITDTGIIDSCYFKGLGNSLGVLSNCRDFTLNNCLFDRSVVTTTRSGALVGSNPVYKQQTFSNNVFKNTTGTSPALFIMQVQGVDDSYLTNATIQGNVFTKCGGSAVRGGTVSHVTISNNTVIDCSRTGYGAAAFTFEAGSGYIDGNTVMNITDGLFAYAFEYSNNSASNQYVVTANNFFKGMGISPVHFGFTASPAVGTWSQGMEVAYWSTPAGGTPGWLCTSSGTFSAASTTGSITSGSANLTVASAAGFSVGDYITIAGVTGIVPILAISGLVFTIGNAADATVAAAAVVTPDPIFKTLAAIAA